MKSTYITRIFVIILSASSMSCSNYMQDLPMHACAPLDQNNSDYSKATELNAIMEELVSHGVPGCGLAIFSEEEGWWTSADGFAKIENGTQMESCHLQYLQSIAKTYMAVAILKLQEQGKIDLNLPITTYLPRKLSDYITSAETITITMLLNHTSGIPEYNAEPAYITKLLQHPDHQFKPEDYLKYIDGKALSFKPGSKYSYRNTNYLILALIADAVTGNHAEFISDEIFEPLGLTNTFYRNDPNYPEYSNLVNAYWDRYGNSIIENASQLQRNNVAALIGDDGIVATPIDAVKFLKGLMEGQLLSSESLARMKTWVNDGSGNPTYGLGLDHATFNGRIAYGHSGGGIGAGCQLYYFPDQGVYMFVGINLGTVTDSPIHAKLESTIDRIYEVILK